MQQGGDNGLAKCKFVEDNSQEDTVIFISIDDGTKQDTLETPLLKYLTRKADQATKSKSIYKNVNEWEDANLFDGKEAFASQWGAIRSSALQYKDNDKIEEAIKEYISHGVKAEDWYGARAKALEDFMSKNKANLWAAIINLSSEMAKKCRRK